MITLHFFDENENEHYINILDEDQSEYFPRWKNNILNAIEKEFTITKHGKLYTYTFSALHERDGESLIESKYFYESPEDAFEDFRKDYSWITF